MGPDSAADRRPPSLQTGNPACWPPFSPPKHRCTYHKKGWSIARIFVSPAENPVQPRKGVGSRFRHDGGWHYGSFSGRNRLPPPFRGQHPLAAAGLDASQRRPHAAAFTPPSAISSAADGGIAGRSGAPLSRTYCSSRRANAWRLRRSGSAVAGDVNLFFPLGQRDHRRRREAQLAEGHQRRVQSPLTSVDEQDVGNNPRIRRRAAGTVARRLRGCS